jgi:hypothetical protein
MYVHDEVTAEALIRANRVLGLQEPGVFVSIPGTQKVPVYRYNPHVDIYPKHNDYYMYHILIL